MATDRSKGREHEAPGGMSVWVKVTLVTLAFVALGVLAVVVVSGGGAGGHQIPEHARPPGLPAVPSSTGWVA